MSTGLGEIVLYRAADGGPALDVRLERESVWLDAHQMAELFGRDRTVIVRTFAMFMTAANCRVNQPVQKMHRLPPMEKSARWISTIWT